MSEEDKQEIFLMAIDTLKSQYEFQKIPCIALLISRYYRLLSLLNIAKSKQEIYSNHSKSWLICHTTNPRHSQKMQNQLNNLVQHCEFTSTTQHCETKSG
ncbi:MAG: hypothetical protein ABL884_04600 [Methyloglobulus sp.]